MLTYVSCIKRTTDSKQNIRAFIEWQTKYLFYYSPVLVVWQDTSNQIKVFTTVNYVYNTHHILFFPTCNWLHFQMVYQQYISEILAKYYGKISSFYICVETRCHTRLLQKFCDLLLGYYCFCLVTENQQNTSVPVHYNHF
jgi:hypothetical protein